MYTYGQPRDRIEYARRRVHAFSSGDTARPRLEIDDLKKAEARQFYLVVPTPTSAHASPPPIAIRLYGDAGSASPAPSAEPPPAPGDQCAVACHDSYAQCARPCEPDAAPADRGCKACESDYKACMKRCFQ
jgi:hypothetical protein